MPELFGDCPCPYLCAVGARLLLVTCCTRTQVLDANEEGRREATRPTLFYLPHCEADLCNNLVAANSAPAQHACTAILGNSFAQYAERWALAGTAQAQHRKQRPAALLGAVEQGRVLELPVAESGFAVAGAFNDMSLHLFPPRTGALLGLRWSLERKRLHTQPNANHHCHRERRSNSGSGAAASLLSWCHCIPLHRQWHVRGVNRTPKSNFADWKPVVCSSGTLAIVVMRGIRTRNLASQFITEALCRRNLFLRAGSHAAASCYFRSAGANPSPFRRLRA